MTPRAADAAMAEEEAGRGAVAAWPWLVGVAAALAGLALAGVVGSDPAPVLVAVVAALLAGGPAAFGVAGRSAGVLPALALGTAGAALLAGAAALALAQPFVSAMAAAGGIAAGGVGLAAAGPRRPPAVAWILALAALLLAGLLIGPLAGLACGAAVAGLAAARAALPPEWETAMPSGRWALLGLLGTVAALSGPAAAWITEGPAAALGLALVVAMPGMVVVALSPRGGHGLAATLLLVQTAVAAAALGAEAAPVLAGLFPLEDAAAFRRAVLGALFLPAFAALLAALLPDGRAAVVLLLLAAATGLGVAADPGWGALAGPLLATGLAGLLVRGR